MADKPEDIPHRLRDRMRRTGRIGKAVASAGLRRIVRRRDEDDRLFGEALAGELDQMKGMAMKVGQILSYLDGALPEETARVLQRLQAGAEPVALPTVLAVLEAELGAPVRDLFESFDPEPVAAASIGQVHRARFQGRPVAVKIRYPHVRETFEADTKNLRRLASVASLATAVDGQAIVDELRDRLLEECDYAREARWQAAFARAFADDPDVIIPEIIQARSSEAVLTSTFHEGTPIYRFAEQADAAARARVGQALLRFTWRSFLSFGTIQADPHPGNFLCQPDGRVVFLDFGCVRSFPPGFHQSWRELIEVVVEGRRAGFEPVVRASGMVGRESFDFDLWWEVLRWQLRPYLQERFHLRRSWVMEGQRFYRPDNPNNRRMAIPPPWIWLQRLMLGLHSVLIRLDVELPCRSILLSAMAESLRPLQLEEEAS